MIKITIPSVELYDEENECFYNSPEQVIKMEHSLASISKWEAKYHIPFIDTKDKTMEQEKYYFYCMCLDDVDEDIVDKIPYTEIHKIEKYLEDPATATWINDKGGRPSRRIITSELVYCWMFSLNIPLECEFWNFNRLCTLIKVCNIENSPPKKMSKSEIFRSNRSLNAARRAALGTKG